MIWLKDQRKCRSSTFLLFFGGFCAGTLFLVHAHHYGATFPTTKKSIFWPVLPRAVESIRHNLECWPRLQAQEVFQLVRDYSVTKNSKCLKSELVWNLNLSEIWTFVTSEFRHTILKKVCLKCLKRNSYWMPEIHTSSDFRHLLYMVNVQNLDLFILYGQKFSVNNPKIKFVGWNPFYVVWISVS